MKKVQTLHFAGVGGIGMSGLAAFSRSLGIETTGSDRASSASENSHIFSALENLGVKIYPQDGSAYKDFTPDYIVYSTALEDDNPDFINAPASARQIHRSEAMELLIKMSGERRVISIGGTSGKTSVSSRLSEALYRIGADPSFLVGGLLNAFEKESPPGNFRSGQGEFFVLEADESDKSLLNYTSDVAVVLNIGTDHYSKEELAEVFRKFIAGSREFALVEDAALESIGSDTLGDTKIVVFSTDFNAPETIDSYPVFKLDSYRVEDGCAYCSFDGLSEIALNAPGLHNAANALAVYALLRNFGYGAEESKYAVSSFSGVKRRFDFIGRTECGAAVYDDYAHNVEKLLSCISASHDALDGTDGRTIIFFQPHGFTPLGFMREELFEMLEKTLHKDDIFALMDVYYAGGTASFKPTSQEVGDDFISRSCHPECYRVFDSRIDAEKFAKNHAKSSDLLIIAGARDNSLTVWAKKICKKLDF